MNSIIYKKSIEQEECFGMGTTLVTAIIYKDNLYVANVGDSRCYVLNDTGLNQISIDHSVVEELVRANVITEEEARNHPRRNHITRAMGTDEMVIVDIFKSKLKENDLIELVRANVITEEEARNHPRRNHITRAMGTDEMVIVDIFKSKLKENDLILLASDGLTGCVDKEDIKNMLLINEEISEINKKLIDMANDVSGKDNVSVVLIKHK